MLKLLSRVNTPAFCLLAFALLTTACGQYKDKERKDYHFYLNTNDTSLKNATLQLINQFNGDIGFQALHITDTNDEDVSPIFFVDHLQDNTNKIGRTYWETFTSQEPVYRQAEIRPLNRTVTYTMNVEFDKSYFESRMGSDKSTVKWQELYILFCHELGHGFQMDHDENNHASVMFPAVEARSDKDFQGYFARARAFFAK